MKAIQNINRPEYQIDFSRIDNPVEAVLLPLPALDAGLLAARPEGFIEAGGDRVEFQSRGGILRKTEKVFTRGGEESRVELKKSGPGRRAKAVQGSFGESEIDLKINNLQGNLKYGSYEVEGKIGEVEVRETVSVDFSNRLTSQPVMTKKGIVGGLDYEENYYITPMSKCVVSSGHLGDMPISRRIFRSSNQSQKGDGRIGEIEFDEFLRAR